MSVRRTGIDISPTRCAVVDAELVSRGRHEPKALRVHRFASFTHADSPQELSAALNGLVERQGFARRAWVNVWDVANSHQYVQLPTAPDAVLAAAARHRGASLLGLADEDIIVATAVGSPRGEPGRPKTEVSFFAAASSEIRQRLEPVVDAGFQVEGVTTPCGALWSQARFRRPALPGEVHAYVALGPSMSALGIFSDGFLLYGRDLHWGYVASAVGSTIILEREDLASRIAAELRRSFLYLKQFWPEDVSQVFLSGDMPEIRSLTAPLIERLNVEVETLDTLDGIDPRTLPDGFAEQAASFRLASAIAVEPPPANLLPTDAARARPTKASVRAFVAGAAAAVAFAAFLHAEASVTSKHAERSVSVVERARLELRRRVITTEAVNAARTDDPLENAAASDAEGTRLSRVVTAVFEGATAGIDVAVIRVVRDGTAWMLTIEGSARHAGPTPPRDAVGAFLRALRQSPLLGAPRSEPIVRFAGTSGDVTVTVDYLIRR